MRLFLSAVFCFFIQIISFQHSEGKSVAAALQKTAKKDIKGKYLYFSQHSRSNGYLKSSFFEDLPALSRTPTKCCKSPLIPQERPGEDRITDITISGLHHFYLHAAYYYSPDHWCPKHAFW